MSLVPIVNRAHMKLVRGQPHPPAQRCLAPRLFYQRTLGRSRRFGTVLIMSGRARLVWGFLPWEFVLPSALEPLRAGGYATAWAAEVAATILASPSASSSGAESCGQCVVSSRSTLSAAAAIASCASTGTALSRVQIT